MAEENDGIIYLYFIDMTIMSLLTDYCIIYLQLYNKKENLHLKRMSGHLLVFPPPHKRSTLEKILQVIQHLFRCLLLR